MKTKMQPQMLTLTLGSIALGAILSAFVFSTPVAHAAGAKQIAPWDAMKAATAKAGGKAIMATYVSEGGKFMYDVIVVNGKSLSEVEVDATTGKAGTVEKVTPAEEGKELTADLQKAIGEKPSGEADKEEKEEDEAAEKSGGKKP